VTTTVPGPPDAKPDIARVYAEQGDRLRRVAYLMVGRRDAAEDLVQEAFARTQGRWHRIDTPAAYVRTALVNLCLDWRHRAAVERERPPPPVEAAVHPPEVDETWHLLADLPHDQRVVLVLRFYEDLGVDEVARLVGCRPATVRTRTHRALARLRKEMTP
jgi:RNA polymerase sigma-70 factor (sigma-E family)